MKYFNISAKFPFLDQNLINLAYSVPLTLKLKCLNKWIFKEAISTIDNIILKREKRMMKFPKRETFEANKRKIKKFIQKSKVVNLSPFDSLIIIHRKFIISLWYTIFAPLVS